MNIHYNTINYFVIQFWFIIIGVLIWYSSNLHWLEEFKWLRIVFVRAKMVGPILSVHHPVYFTFQYKLHVKREITTVGGRARSTSSEHKNSTPTNEKRKRDKTYRISSFGLKETNHHRRQHRQHHTAAITCKTAAEEKYKVHRQVANEGYKNHECPQATARYRAIHSVPSTPTPTAAPATPDGHDVYPIPA